MEVNFMQRVLINNFSNMIEDYYKNNVSEDVVFDFMHVVFNYTYLDKNIPIVDFQHDDGVLYTTGMRNGKRTVFIPVVVSKDYYDKNYDNDSSYDKRTIYIDDVINLGTSDDMSYDEVYGKIAEMIPSECRVVDNNTMTNIANENGYDSFSWEIFDKSAVMPAFVYSGPQWVTNAYGIVYDNVKGR